MVTEAAKTWYKAKAGEMLCLPKEGRIPKQHNQIRLERCLNTPLLKALKLHVGGTYCWFQMCNGSGLKVLLSRTLSRKLEIQNIE